MNVLNAVKRIIFASHPDELPGETTLDSPVELDARFAKGREADLRKIQGFLRSGGLLFSLKDGALFRRISGAAIEWEVHEVIRLMNGFGCGMTVQHNAMKNRVWAVSGHGGITLQRLRQELRIFYTTR